MSALKGKEILLGVSGGIACYKAVEVLRRLKKAGAEVQVVMTTHARRFIQPLTFQTLSQRAVGSTLFDLDQEHRIGHIQLAEQAQLALVAPCTANVLAKLRAGMADDLLTTLLLATTAPIYLAPAMNDNMLAHRATRENLEVLQGRGVRIIPPETGFLAEGRHGPGRLAAPETIVACLEAHFAQREDNAAEAAKPLAGWRVLVTAGPTVEAIDPVRFISNYSSGRMGFALAEACQAAGAKVTLVRGPVALADPQGIKIVPVDSAEEMYQAVLERMDAQDVFCLTAAVADFRPDTRQAQKIKRNDATELNLKLVPNADIAAEVGRRKSPTQLLVAFAAESQDLLANAEKKLISKRADLVVANDITLPGSGFNSTCNKVILISRSSSTWESAPEHTELPVLDKQTVAEHIAARVAALLRSGEPTGASSP